MTTNNDDFQKRIVDSDWGIAKEWSIGVPIDGMVDPTGEYPKRDIFFGLSTSQAARGAKINSISYGGSYYDINLEIAQPTPSIFPFAQVNETPSGHSVEVDDTPGGERILIKHRTGSGIELKPDGTIVVSSADRKIEVTRGDSKVIVSGSGDMVYEGNLNMKVQGDYNLDVDGNYNVTVGTNNIEKIKGSKRSTVARTRSEITNESRNTKTYGPNVDLSLSGYKQIVKGGSYRDGISGQDPALHQIVHGDMETNIKYGYTISAIETQFTNEENFASISRNLKISSKNGLVGGADVVHFGSVYTGPDKDGVPGGGVTHYGSLVGRSLESWTSKYSLYADEAYQAHISSFATKADRADDAYRADWATAADKAKSAPSGSAPTGSKPTTNDYNQWTGSTTHDGSKKLNKDPAFMYGTGNDGGGEDSKIGWYILRPNSLMVMPGYVDSSERLDMPEGSTTQDIMIDRTINGYKRIQVDPNDSLANQIGLLNYREYLYHHPDIFEIRAKLRSFRLDNAAAYLTDDQKSVIEELVGRGLLNGSYLAPMRAEVEQTISRTSVLKRFGRRLLGNPIENRSKSFSLSVSQHNFSPKKFVIDPKYNAYLYDYKSITAGTRLSKNVTLGMFLGTPGSKTSLDSIPGTPERQQIVANLLLHAHIVDQVQSCDDFKNYNLVVSEGVYAPPEKEHNYIKSRSSASGTWENWNKGKMSGRVIVYQLLNNKGLVDWNKTWDLAVWMRDHVIYDDLAIDYDTFNFDRSETIQIVVRTPKMYRGRSYQGSYSTNPKYRISTWYNHKCQSSTSLIKLSDPFAEDTLVGIPDEDSTPEVVISTALMEGSREGDTWTGSSTNIGGNYNNTTARVTISFNEAKTVTLSKTISSEEGYDRSVLFINGEELPTKSITGDDSLEETFQDVEEIEVQYRKDYSQSEGDDKLDVTISWS